MQVKEAEEVENGRRRRNGRPQQRPVGKEGQREADKEKQRSADKEGQMGADKDTGAYCYSKMMMRLLEVCWSKHLSMHTYLDGE